MYNILDYSGISTKQINLLDRKAVSIITKRFFKGLNGIDNIYTQHNPLIIETIEDFIKGKLNLQSYPYVDNSQGVYTKK